MDEKKISLFVDDAGEAQMVREEDFDWGGWFTKNAPDVRLPEVLKCAKALRGKYSKVGVVGFCWGGSVVFKLAQKSNAELFDVATICQYVYLSVRTS